MDRTKELASNTIILGIGQLVPKLISMVLLPLLTSYLTTEEYGNYDLIQSFASLLIPMVTLQIQQAVFRYLLSSQEKEDKTKYVTSALIFLVCSSIICYPIVYVILRLLKLGGFISLLICVLYCSEAVYTLLGQVVRGLGFNLKYSISVIVFSASNLLFTAIFLAGLHLGLWGVVVSLTCGYGMSVIYMLFSSGMSGFIDVRAIDKQYLKKLLSFSAPIVPSSIALWIVNLSDRLIIIYFLGSSANGVYAVANKVPALFSTAYAIFNLAWTETASKVKDDGDPSEYYSRLFKSLYNFLIGMINVMVVVTPLIFEILVRGDGAYDAAINQVPILYYGVFFNSLVNFYSGIYIAYKRTKQVGYSSIAGAVMNAAINLIFVNTIGLYAASISTAISFFIIAIFRMIDLKKIVNIKYDWQNIALGMLCFALVSICLFINNIPAFVLGAILAIVYNCLENRKLIVSLLRKFKR